MHGFPGQGFPGQVRFGPAQVPSGAFRVPMARLELVFRCRDVCWLPPARGALWRSVLGPQLASLQSSHSSGASEQGSAIRRIRRCYMGERRVAPVPMPPDLYNWLFNTSPHHCLSLPAFGTAPHPLTIDCPAANEWEFVPPGHTIRFQITLAGRLIFAWKTLLLAFANAATRGIGKAISLDGRRGRAELVSVYQVWRAGNMAPRPVHVAGMGFQVEDLEIILPEPPPASMVQVQLASPLRLGRGGKLVGNREFSPADLFSAMARRTGGLMASETGRRAELDFVSLKRCWNDIKMYECNLEWSRQSRWSSNQQKKLPLDGITGSFIIDLRGKQELFDLLWLAQWLGVGKGTMMGLGILRLSPV